MCRDSYHRIQWMSLFRAIAIALLISVILIPSLVCGEKYSREGLDPTPIIRILQDTLSAITYGDYDSAEKLINLALSISLPKRVEYIHVKLYTQINNLLELMRDIDELSKGVEARSSELKVVIYRLYRLRLDLKEYFTEYLNTLSKYFKDREVRHVMSEKVENAVSMLFLRIDELIDELTMLYIFGTVNIVPLNITITMPQSIRSGNVFSIGIYIEAPPIIKYVNSTIHVSYGNIYEVLIHRELPVNKEINISSKAPLVEDLLRRTSIIMNETSIEVKVRVITVVHNTTYIGTEIARSKLIFKEPLCEFYISRHIYPNQPLEVSVLAYIDYPLNTTIYIDKSIPKNLVLNTVLKPGNNTFELPILNLSTGDHILIFEIKPRGYYLGTTYYTKFEVVREPLIALIEVQRVIIGPPFTLSMSVDVDSKTPYIIEVFMDGNRLIKEKFHNESGIRLRANTPITLFVWRSSVVISIEPLDPRYEPMEFSTDIYIINTPLLILASALLGFAIITPTTSKYISISMQYLLRYLHRAGISEKRVRRISSEVIVRTRIFFRPSKLVNLYRRLLRIIAPYVGIPHEYETLREFCRRVSIGFRELIYRFIKLYELDLYSKHDVDVKEAEEIVKRLEKLESK